MGAASFYESVKTTEPVEVAYNALCDEAAYEHGHSPYNGTISTTYGVHVVSQTPMPLAEAERVADRRIDNLDKWSHCEAIPLVADSACTTRTITIPISVDGATFEDHEASHNALLSAANSRCTKNEWVCEVRVITQPGERSQSAGWVVKGKTIAKPGTGSSVVRYYLRDQYNRTLADRAGYPTQAAARSAAVKVADASTDALTIRVAAEKIRSSGEALVTVKRVITKATATLTVTIGKTKPNATRGGWLFYGFAGE